MSLPRIAVTTGEPAGIGPELCLAIAQQSFPCELIFIGDRGMLEQRARDLDLALKFHDYTPSRGTAHVAGEMTVLHIALATNCTPGKLDARNGAYVMATLDRAVDSALRGEIDAMVTAPVHKGILNDAGFAFTGHTEHLAKRTRSTHPVMMLAAGALRVALATTHLPLRQVSDAITIDSLCSTLEIVDAHLKLWWGISNPRIAVCGLNPHAGEGGHLGDEELRVIAPAIARMRERGLQLAGPLPADTVFVPRLLAGYDAVLAMYHDQGLPVIKHAAFEQAVNVTLGLPIVRTSVDHGTALELAGTGRGDPGSLAAAIRLAIELAARARG